MRKIAIYGKGGIGKSTTTSNMSAALAKKGHRVMQIGCDPKADSTKNLMKGKRIPTVLEQLREKGDELTLADIVFEGYAGVLCVESGGPRPGGGCAGRGIISAFEKLEELDAFGHFKPDIVIYDVLGDVVCGGFAMPIREGYAREVFIVSSGEMMSLYAAYNIAQAIDNFKKGLCKVRRHLVECKNIADEEVLVEQAAKEIGTEVVAYIPRSGDIQIAENQGELCLSLHSTLRCVRYTNPLQMKYCSELKPVNTDSNMIASSGPNLLSCNCHAPCKQNLALMHYYTSV